MSNKITFRVSRTIFRGTDEEESFRALLESIGLSLTVVSLVRTPIALVVQVETLKTESELSKLLDDLGYPVGIISAGTVPVSSNESVPRTATSLPPERQKYITGSEVSGNPRDQNPSAAPESTYLKPKVERIGRADQTSGRGAISTNITSNKQAEPPPIFVPKKNPASDTTADPKKDIFAAEITISAPPKRNSGSALASTIYPPRKPPPLRESGDARAIPRKISETTSSEDKVPQAAPNTAQKNSHEDQEHVFSDDVQKLNSDRIFEKLKKADENESLSQSPRTYEENSPDNSERSIGEQISRPRSKDGSEHKTSLIVGAVVVVISGAVIFAYQADLFSFHKPLVMTEGLVTNTSTTTSVESPRTEINNSNESNIVSNDTDQPKTAEKKDNNVEGATRKATSPSSAIPVSSTSKNQSTVQQRTINGGASPEVRNNPDGDDRRAEGVQLSGESQEVEARSIDEGTSLPPVLQSAIAELDKSKTKSFTDFRDQKLLRNMSIRRGAESITDYELNAPVLITLCVRVDGTAEQVKVTSSNQNSKRLLRLVEQWAAGTRWRWKNGTPVSTKCGISLTVV